MICTLKFKSQLEILNKLETAFVASNSATMKALLEDEFDRNEIPNEAREINNSPDGRFLWDSQLLSIESIERTPKTLLVTINFVSSFNEWELCNTLRKWSKYIGEISVEFSHESDLSMTSGWYKYKDGIGELYGTKRSNTELPKSDDPYLNEYFAQRESTQAVLTSLMEVIELKQEQAGRHGDVITAEAVSQCLDEIKSKYEKCDYNPEFIEYIKSKISLAFSKSDVDGLVKQSEDIDDMFRFATSSVKKYKFRLDQVKRYGLLDEKGNIIQN